jgi:hypothetical protein
MALETGAEDLATARNDRLPGSITHAPLVPSTSSLAICGASLYGFDRDGRICAAPEPSGYPRRISVPEETFPLRYPLQTLGVTFVPLTISSSSDFCDLARMDRVGIALA